jgi:UDP:flavonoid glycosyltransferase YjiC (YdhE family)
VGKPFSDERSRQFVRMGAGMGPPNQSMWSDEEIRDYAQAEARFFRENDVGVAVTGFTLTALLSTRLAGIPLVTEHAGSMVPPVWERKTIEPWLRSTIPGVRFLPYRARRWFSNLGMNRVSFYCDGFNRVARELGVEGIPSFAALLLADLVLVTDTPDVLGISSADMEAWRPTGVGYRKTTRLRYAGPIFAALEKPMPDRVARFLEGKRPIVYVAITSAQEHEVRGVVGALRDCGARVLVAGTVHALDDLASDDVLVERVLPSHQVMPRVDLAVTAGGQGSVQCAMAAGTPLIAIPLQPEQDFNGQVVERHHAGRRITMADAMTPKLAAFAREMLASSAFKEGAMRVRASYAKVDGAAIAADAILEHATLSL